MPAYSEEDHPQPLTTGEQFVLVLIVVGCAALTLVYFS